MKKYKGDLRSPVFDNFLLLLVFNKMLFHAVAQSFAFVLYCKRREIGEAVRFGNLVLNKVCHHAVAQSFVFILC